MSARACVNACGALAAVVAAATCAGGGGRGARAHGREKERDGEAGGAPAAASFGSRNVFLVAAVGSFGAGRLSRAHGTRDDDAMMTTKMMSN